MMEELAALREQAEAELRKAGTEEDLLNVRTRYLGRKGLLTGLLRNISNVAPDERPEFGKRCNEVKEDLSARIDQLLAGMAASKRNEGFLRERIDVTLPGRGVRHGILHPVTQVREEICRIFAALGFSVVEGPEVELDYYNFEALNIPKDHPARDMQDTFYIEDNIVLRTHTSPVQVRIMEKTKPPVRVLSPGRVYRRDSDISHTPMFHQIEGLLVDRGVTFGDLKGTLTVFLKQVFGEETALRFRPSFFPFTEPSAEVDIRCVICNGRGCRVCGQSGWLEILGSGMVDPEVF
ncbi:MAG: phenylalanine--tRNA ligase subunit alpha, partial [Deltaproteobacteria bacterium]|nr:phenylalanine--tRNA ligase subunit alpha [Deltaproteobacteria bacterium]